MLTYAQFDLIADAYNPLPVVLFLFTLGIQTKHIGIRAALRDFIAVSIAVVLIYALMFMDKYGSFFAYLKLDFSTHTAFALVFVIYLSMRFYRFSSYVIGSILLYFGLMLYQQYHPILDILITTLIVAPLTYLVFKLLLKKEHPAN